MGFRVRDAPAGEVDGSGGDLLESMLLIQALVFGGGFEEGGEVMGVG